MSGVRARLTACAALYGAFVAFLVAVGIAGVHDVRATTGAAQTAAVSAAERNLLVLLVVALVAAAGIAWWLGRLVVVPLCELVGLLGQASRGDLTGRASGTSRAELRAVAQGYNAMVDALMAVDATRHIVIAGEMLELGPDAATLHAQCGEYMKARGIDAVIGVRGDAAELVRVAGDIALFVDTPEKAGAWMLENLREGDAVLLKASRGVQLERALTPLGIQTTGH